MMETFIDQVIAWVDSYLANHAEEEPPKRSFVEVPTSGLKLAANRGVLHGSHDLVEQADGSAASLEINEMGQFLLAGGKNSVYADAGYFCGLLPGARC